MNTLNSWLLTVPIFVFPALAQDWQIHSNWCANLDRGSSHQVYLDTCKRADQYDSVLACQNDALRGNGDGGRAVRQVSDAGRAAVNAFMENRKPSQCRSSDPPLPSTAPPPASASDYVSILNDSGAGNACSNRVDNAFGAWWLRNTGSRNIVATVHLTILHGSGAATESDQQVRVPPRTSQMLGCGGNIGSQAVWRIVGAHF